ncbi:glycosyltransferase family protein [Flavobacterium frigidimaris]|nr:hypothetical protein [Flavobacterium frigidimaris]
MKLAAIVIIYYPDIKDLQKNIFRYIDDIDKLLIWDNSPSDSQTYRIALDGYEDKVEVLTTGKNEFIAYPLNQAVKWCMENNFTHLLSMDQDSLFDVGEFKLYKNRVHKNLGNKNVIFGVNPNNKFRKQNDFLPVNWFITSGSIYDVNIINKLGGFREDYKIDCVDNEICYRTNLNGYRTVVDTKCHLNQIFGNHKKTIFGFTTLGYSPFRTYSILCNHILLWKQYPQQIEKELKKEIVKEYFIYRFVKILLSENRKIDKSMALFYGFVDGIRGVRKNRFC